MALLIFVLALAALDLLIWQLGKDSRPLIEDDHGQRHINWV